MSTSYLSGSPYRYIFEDIGFNDASWSAFVSAIENESASINTAIADAFNSAVTSVNFANAFKSIGIGFVKKGTLPFFYAALFVFTWLTSTSRSACQAS
jgi:hypothetical protein